MFKSEWHTLLMNVYALKPQELIKIAKNIYEIS